MGPWCPVIPVEVVPSVAGGDRNGGSGQRWATFLKNHAERMWVCDFIQTHDLLFRQVYAFFLVHLASRRVV